MTTEHNSFEDDLTLQKAEEAIQDNLDIIFSCGSYMGIRDYKQKVRDAIEKKLQLLQFRSQDSYDYMLELKRELGL